MKPRSSSIAVWKTLIVAAAVLALGSVAGSALAAAAPNQITAHDQDITSGVIVIDSVTAAQDGWVVIYRNPNFTSGEIVGYAPVHQGSNTDVKVTLDTAKVGDLPTLWAQLHVDNDVKGIFEWGLRGMPLNDTPVVQNGQPVVASFGTAASMAAPTMTSAPTVPVASAPAAPVTTKAPVTAKPAATTGPIVIADQDLNSGVIVASSVTSPVDGWIVVYKDPNNFTAGQIVGYAPVHMGANSNVKVTIDTAKAGDLPTLFAVLQADNGVPGIFEWGWKGQAYDDAPVVENGHNIMTGFGTAASMAAATMAPAAAAPAPVAAAPVATKAPVTANPVVAANLIVVGNQDITSGVIVANAVTAPQNGWVVVYKNPNLSSGEIVGYAPVHQGANTDVKVTLDTAKIGDAPTLWMVLHADNDVKGIFEWGWRGQPYNDQPIVVNGHDIVAAFGTAADQ
jgi:hypothetical protein